MRTLTTLPIVLLLLAVLLVPVASGQGIATFETLDTAIKQFRLFNDCKPMRLIVEAVSKDGRELGLTEAALRVAAESRLRGARLYTSSSDDFPAYLYVNVNVVGKAFSVSVQYNKVMLDFATNEVNRAVSWHHGWLGTYGPGGTGYIVATLSLQLDEFILLYLRVNEESCTGAPGG